MGSLLGPCRALHQCLHLTPHFGWPRWPPLGDMLGEEKAGKAAWGGGGASPIMSALLFTSCYSHQSGEISMASFCHVPSTTSSCPCSLRALEEQNFLFQLQAPEQPPESTKEVRVVNPGLSRAGLREGQLHIMAVGGSQ